MSVLTIKNRLKRVEDRVTFVFNQRWCNNMITIFYSGEEPDYNNNRKYRFKYKGKDLIYDNLEDFYKEYNVYPKRDINPHVIKIVDNSHLEKYLYEADEEG